MAVMEQVVADVRNSLVRIETRMEAGFEKIDARFQKVAAKVDRLLFLGIAAVVAIFGTVAHALHWL
jgi:hypothetical protein